MSCWSSPRRSCVAAFRRSRKVFVVARQFPGNAHSGTWLGRRWSRWATLDKALGKAEAPSQPGVYRIRNANGEGLLYIGESESIRRRLASLRRGMSNVRIGKSVNTGHWAAPCIFHHEQGGALVEVSWLEDQVPEKAERRGLESEYIAAHRWAAGCNPSCQFVAPTGVEE